MRDADTAGGCPCVEAGRIGEISVPSLQFCCEPKFVFKNKVYRKKSKEMGGRGKGRQRLFLTNTWKGKWVNSNVKNVVNVGFFVFVFQFYY